MPVDWSVGFDLTTDAAQSMAYGLSKPFQPAAVKLLGAKPGVVLQYLLLFAVADQTMGHARLAGLLSAKWAGQRCSPFGADSLFLPGGRPSNLVGPQRFSAPLASIYEPSEEGEAGSIPTRQSGLYQTVVMAHNSQDNQSSRMAVNSCYQRRKRLSPACPSRSQRNSPATETLPAKLSQPMCGSMFRIAAIRQPSAPRLTVIAVHITRSLPPSRAFWV